ncbi:MAG: hypothetical protein ACKVW3_09745 [Phycisphaerales bacterium]
MNWRRTIQAITSGVVASSLTIFGGCASYVTPGRPADFRALGITPEGVRVATDPSIEAKLARRPTAAFPTAVAAVRVQGQGYRSHRQDGFGEGRFTVLTARDAESDKTMKKLASLPMQRGLAPVNRLIVPAAIQSERDLREVAATLQADILLLYTFDTRFETETAVPIIGPITLGLFPTKVSKCRSTASAAFLDTRTGYIYGLAEATESRSRLSNSWNTTDALDNAREDSERAAFDKLADELIATWNGIVETYGPGGESGQGTPSPGNQPAGIGQ